MKNKIAMIGIIVEDLSYAEIVNDIFHEHAPLILGRMGIPYKERGISIITLIIEGTEDEISNLTYKLNKIPQITVKSIMPKKN
ncbi:TM1266 family iron-only hydrogenase system putative regulator [Garciella nitratireducens]|uniref:TM1266 family iron-only hydrogenase system putative regulator n=1 Tax=Garciella nitratireducens TaxID=218205 RepID=UPI001BD605FF|nr:TM1266 family iron-only hydrogenase system putative regulator [Garciella nitratireducens]